MEGTGRYSTEEALLKALRLGKTDACEQVVRTYSNSLLHQAFNRLQNRADAEDLVQDLFTNLWEKRETLHVSQTIEGYLHVALRNRILNHIARAKLRAEAAEHLLQQMDQLQTSILDIIAEKDLRQTLSSVVSSLPENMQKIFVLRGEDHSLREIAEALGLAEQTVKSYSAELTRRIRVAVVEKYPDINHSALMAFILLLTKS